MRMSTTSNKLLGGTVTWHVYPGSPAPAKPGVDYQVTVVAPSNMRPYACPVCGGRGIVSRGFYDYWLAASITDAVPEMCRSCQGAGIVWGGRKNE